MLRTYGDSLATAVAASLAAAAVVAVVDASSAGGGILFYCLGLYAGPALLTGIALGIIGGAWRATFGDGSVGRAMARLRDDREVDRSVVAALIASCLAAVVLTLIVAAGALVLVANVERKVVGALLLGGVVVFALPAVFLVGLPIYRVARPIARVVPRIGPVPAAAVLVLIAVAVAAIAVVAVLTRGLDWRALNLGWMVSAILYAIVFAGWLAIWRWPLRGVRDKIKVRGALAAGAAVAAALLAVIVLRGDVGGVAAEALAERTQGARLLVAIGRKLIDRDGDGVSAFMGGPDCDDSDPDVNPGAPEIPGNKIDDNCIGGDRPVEAGGGGGGSPTEKPPQQKVERPAFSFDGNVLIIAIDTVRADRLGIAGYRRTDYDGSLTPNIDKLAESSVYFERVWAQGPNTPRSFPSLFSSRYPSQVKVTKSFANYSDVLADNELLFETLQRGGLRTIGISSHFYFDKAPGIRQGFTDYDNEGALDIAGSNKDSASPRIVPRVTSRLAELGRGGERFAMFVHLFEPHSTYMEHEGFTYNQTKTEALMQRYDFEIAFVDRAVGQILDALDDSGLAGKTMVVLVSDHGEAFGNHSFAGKRMFFHGQTLYDELLRVPVLMKLPGVTAARVDDPAALIDVAPTIADALGLEVPAGFNGRSLLPRLLGKPMPPRPIFAELLPAPSWNESAKAMITGDGQHKLIYVISQNRFELYDLTADPTEQKNLFDAQPDLGGKLKDELVRWMEVELP